MRNKKIKKVIILFIFIFVFLSPILFIHFNFDNLNSFEDPNLSAGETGNGTLSMFNETISEGDNLQEGIYYNFTADLIDLDNCSHDFTSGGFLETEFKDGTWFSPDNDTITVQDLINFNDYIPGFEDFYNIVGNLSDWVDDSLDEWNDGSFSTFNSTEVYHYPATFSFTNDIIGGNPADWTITEGVGYTVQVIALEDSHRNVVEHYDNDGALATSMYNVSDSQEYGTVEFWIKNSDNTKRVSIIIDKATTLSNLVVVMRENGQWSYYTNPWVWNDLGAYNSDQWYHVRIDFECGTYGYEGLSADTFDLYVDRVLLGGGNLDFRVVTTSLEYLRFSSHATHAGYYFYVDAIGCSWNPFYCLGDNYHWNYHPATVDFELGHYNATYSFTDEVSGAFPTGWTIIDESGGSIEVISILDRHRKVLRFKDTDAVNTIVVNQDFTDQTSGTVYIEYWIYPEDVNDGEYYYHMIYGSAGRILRIYWDKTGAGVGLWRITTGDAGASVVGTINKWVHFKIEFDIDNYDVSVWIDNIEEITEESFENNGNMLYSRWQTSTAQGTFYLDAIGYSWNPFYTIGDNYYQMEYPTTYDLERGHYYGTYSFTTDITGSNPIGWTISEGVDYTAQVIDLVGGHRNVLEIYDDDNVDYVEAYTAFTGQEYGTIEFWMRTTNVVEKAQLNLYGSTYRTWMYIQNSKWQYYDGVLHDIPNVAQPPVVNTWYHIRIDFECGAGGYEGLGADQIQYTIDGISSGALNFQSGDDTITRFEIASDMANVEFYTYYDAIAYSWDTAYTIGYNRYWESHNDFEGSDITLSGNYIGKYSFEKDDVGTVPNEWNDALSGALSTTIVEATYQGHNKVLECISGGVGDRYRIYQTISSPQATGDIEFWMGSPDTTNLHKFVLHNTNGLGGAVIAVVIYILNDNIYTENGNGAGGYFTTDIGDIIDDQWVHIRVHFDTITDTYDVYIDSVNVGGGYNFFNDNLFGATDLDHITLWGANLVATCYWDAFGYSWDPEYCQVEETWNYLNDFKSWNINPYDITNLFPNNWDYRGVIGGTYSIDGEFGIHKKYLEIYDETDTEFYTGTYSFEEELVGTTSTNIEWVDTDTGGVDTSIYGLLAGHRKFLRVLDDDANSREIVHNFDDAPIISGTVEMWVRVHDEGGTTNYQFCRLRDAVFATGPRIQIKDTAGLNFEAWIGGAMGIVVACNYDQWYHIRMDFECDDGGYMGLAADTYFFYIDGVGYGPYNFAAVVAGIFNWRVYSAAASTSDNYIDSIVYSWDPNYIFDYHPHSDNSIDIGTQIWNTFEENQTTGTLSFWINGDFDKYFRIYLMQDINFATSIKLNGSELWYLDNKTWTLGDDTVTNAWHYIRIAFNTTANTYDLWLDYNDYTYCDHGINFNLTLIDTDIPFQQNVSGIDRILFETQFDASPTIYMVDALLYSWENATLDLNLIPSTYAELDFKVAIDTENYEYICYRLYWAFLTTSSEYVNFTWYNFDTNQWEVIIRDYFDGASPPLGFTEYYNFTYFDDDFLDPYINSSGHMLLRFKILDFNEEFDFYLDELRLLLRDYVHPTIEKIFDWRGIWRYRWWLRINNGTWMWSNWTYFEVIPLFGCANFEGVSESPYTTYWKLLGTGTNVIETFSDDMGAGAWFLYGTVAETFVKSPAESVDYLLDNSTYHSLAADSPAQFGDFVFTKGSGGAAGTLETNDGNYARIDSSTTVLAERYLNYIEPANSDILKQWNDNYVLHHYLALDEAKVDMDGDGKYIEETGDGRHDKWNFNTRTLPAYSVVSKIKIYLYAKAKDAYSEIIYSTSTGQGGSIDPSGGYAWHSATHGGLSLSQADIDSFWLNVETDIPVPATGGLWLETVYVELYITETQYSTDYTITWGITVDPLLTETFMYDYMTTSSVDCDLDIYNWDTTSWLQLESNTGTSYITDSYILTDPYISGGDQVKIRFQTALIASNFDMRLDQIVVDYDDVYIISKYYHGDSLIYMQTNETETETLSLRNVPYGADVDVEEGQYIYFYINSTTENVKVKFYLDDEEQVEYTLLENNVNPNDQIILINIDFGFTFDSVEFTGEAMSETEHFVCYRYTIYGYTSIERVYDMYIDPDGKDDLMCQFGNYTLEIYERDGGSFSLQEEHNITLTEDLLTVIYVPSRVWYLKIYHYAYELSTITITGVENRTLTAGRDEILEIILLEGDYVVNWTNGENGESTIYYVGLFSDQSLIFETTYFSVYFSLFDQYNRRVDDTLFSFYLNNTRKDFGSVELHSPDYNITVYDYLNVIVFNETVTLTGYTEYNIIITVFELQIRHLAYKNSNLTLYETTTHNHIDFSMPPDSSRIFILSNSTYNITWTNGENMLESYYDITLDENYILTLDTTYYSIYFSLYDHGSVRLDDSLFSLYINDSRKDFGFVGLESNNISIIVYDYLNITVFNQTVLLRDYVEYNIIITVFELEIRHLGYENSNITLFETTTHNHINFSMSPDSLNRFILANSSYNCTWTNGENLQATFYEFNLSSNYILTLPTTYFDIHFSLFNFDGLGLEPFLFRFYINNLRKDFGFNMLMQDTNTLRVSDYFNQTLFNRVINLQGFTEYSIYVEVWTMILYNNYSHPIKIKIERNDIEVEQIIEAGLGFPYRMLPKVEYFIKIYHLNGTLLETRDIELDENNKIVSFGFFETEVPFDPSPIVNSYNNIIVLIVLGVGIFLIVIGIVLYLSKKNRELKEKRGNSYLDHKLKATTHTRNLGGG